MRFHVEEWLEDNAVIGFVYRSAGTGTAEGSREWKERQVKARNLVRMVWHKARDFRADNSSVWLWESLPPRVLEEAWGAPRGCLNALGSIAASVKEWQG